MSIRKFILVISLMITMDASGQSESRTIPASGIVEIRCYNLKPGRREELHKLFTEKALPMLKRWKIEVVAYGPSIHDDNSYYLIRSYKSINNMKESEDAFYGSDEWEKGPQEAILDCIKNFTTVVLPSNEKLLEQLKIVQSSAIK